MGKNEVKIEVKESGKGYYQLWVNGEAVLDHENEETSGTFEQAKEYYDKLVKWEVAWYTVDGGNRLEVCVYPEHDYAKRKYNMSLSENGKHRLSNYKWAKNIESQNDGALRHIWDCELTAFIGEKEEMVYFVERVSAQYYFKEDEECIMNYHWIKH
jgi:coenzyme F420-reducing hydrogenase alpha subunit